ncbi:MAG: radical SAM protein [Pseudomonadales bacterium]
MPDAREGDVFQLVLIKPSHYDDDGYVIQFLKSTIPANSLACLYGLAQDCAQRRALGPDVEIRLTACDEMNTRVNVDRIAKSILASGNHGVVAMVGVQSNQFPRAVDLAREFAQRGIQVAIGGFHISGCLAMLPELPPDLEEALELGITLYAGELEGRMDEFLTAAYRKELKPLYNYMEELPGLDGEPVPYLPLSLIKRTASNRTSFDAGRGCPYLCSFCTIINVQGRRSRTRTADDVERVARLNLAQGVTNFFISDDNFTRNQAWQPIFERLAKLREEEGHDIRLMIQVDTMSHKVPGFIELAKRAGTNRVFIGLESINPDALKGARKSQNRITDYRAMLQAWRGIGALTFAGYILGFPNDTPETIERDIRIIQRELPVDILEFFILTPLPGSQDHQELHLKGVPMASDMNLYDTAHVTTAHPLMSKEQWESIFHRAWELYYSHAHVETLLRRGKFYGFPLVNLMVKCLSFSGCMRFEGVHPLDGGLLRRKYRRDRRPGLPIEPPVIFHLKYLAELVSKYARFSALILRCAWLTLRVSLRDAQAASKDDVALTPTSEEELETLEIFTSTPQAREAVDRARKRARRRGIGAVSAGN